MNQTNLDKKKNLLWVHPVDQTQVRHMNIAQQPKKQIKGAPICLNFVRDDRASKWNKRPANRSHFPILFKGFASYASKNWSNHGEIQNKHYRVTKHFFKWNHNEKQDSFKY